MTASHSTPTFDVFQSDSLNNSNSKSTDSQVRWRVRLVHIDFYLNFGASVKSSSGTTSSRTDKSPVIRIFGSSDQGQKVCLHIHQVYPYFYIPFPFSGEKPQYSALDSYLTGLTIEWNKRLGLLLVKNDIDSNDQSPQNNTMQDRKVNHEIHIRQVLLVKGIPYYGFHPGYQLYLKVYVINPFAYNRIVDTFHSGSLLGHRVQTFHSHLSFPLQFMMDFNLYGMDTIELSQVRFRDEPPPLWTSKRSYTNLGNEKVYKQSFCSLEADVWPLDILNQLKVQERRHHALVDLKNHANNRDLNIKLVPSLDTIWRDERVRRERLGLIPLDVTAARPTAIPSEIWDSNANPKLLSQLESVISDRLRNEKTQTRFPTFPEDDIPTTFQAITALCTHAPQNNFESQQNNQRMPNDCQKSLSFDLSSYPEPPQSQFTDEVQDQDDHETEEALLWLKNAEPSSDFSEGANDCFSEIIDLHEEELFLERELESSPATENLELARDEETFSDLLEAVDDALLLNVATPQILSSQGIKTPLPVGSQRSFRGVIRWMASSSSPSGRAKGTPLGSFASKKQKITGFPELKLPKSPHDEETLKTGELSSDPIDVDDDVFDIAQEEDHMISQLDGTCDETPHIYSELDAYFTDSISQMWSPERDADPVDWAFYTDPPRISSPTRHVSSNMYRYNQSAPQTAHLAASVLKYGQEVEYLDPYFSNENDVPTRPTVFAGREFRYCKSSTTAPKIDRSKVPRSKYWTIANAPPSIRKVKEWLASESENGTQRTSKSSLERKISDVEGPTQRNPFGFKYTQGTQDKSSHEKYFLTLLSLEVHANSRKEKLPDPAIDPITAIFYAAFNEDEEDPLCNGIQPGYNVGMILNRESKTVRKTGLNGYETIWVDGEKAMFEKLIEMVRNVDPDILLGYEIQNASWGYLVDRAAVAYDMDLCRDLSRLRPNRNEKKRQSESILASQDMNIYGHRKSSALSSSGRIFLNVWRLMKSELSLTSYTLESIVFHVLHKRVPKFSSETLTAWYKSGCLQSWRTLDYFLKRTQYNLEILQELDYVGRTCEFAKVYGIDFTSVLTRGSQFRVESVMLRVALPENFVMISPSRRQVAEMRAVECLPLIMEPMSRFYKSPVLVLDFQSLYPSVMIAHNYCFSTCLGRVAGISGPQKLGVLSDYEIPMGYLAQLKDHVNISPNGVVFVKQHIRQGVLGRMLAEILDTRVMIKQSMKLYKDKRSLLRMMEARQLGLKLLANVTYGYAGASFSGRMPCVDIADSIVQTGRATLEKSIEVISKTLDWNATVVYGDTDSLFVHLPGTSKPSAFKIGQEIVNTINKMVPYPMKLKFEKVYLPCVLLTKKRYVGFKFESLEEEEPVFDAKGIETVRRDGCPANGKILEKSLKILFRSRDLSELKAYLYRQWQKIMTGRVNIQDFIIAKEVKLGTYTNLPPGALVALKKMKADPRAEPPYGERVPYVVVYNGMEHRLMDLCITPEEYLKDKSLKLHDVYYITKQIIPSLSRIFNLIGIDIMEWYNQMPKVQKVQTYTSSQIKQSKVRTIDQYYSMKSCLTCENETFGDLCDGCKFGDPQTTALSLLYSVQKSELAYTGIQDICRSCSGLTSKLDAEVPCESLDCPVLYARHKAMNQFKEVSNRCQRALESLDETVIDLC